MASTWQGEKQGHYWLFDATTASLSCMIVGVVVIGVIVVVGIVITDVVGVIITDVIVGVVVVFGG